MSSIVYDRSQIVEWLGSRTVAKAGAYSHAVSQLRWHDTILTGRVQGRARHPYQLRVRFNKIEGNTWIDSSCSCPVRFGCKHVAALLLKELEQRPPPQPGVRSELLHWLAAFRNQQIALSSAGRKATHTLAYVLIWSEPPQYHELQLFKARLNANGTIRAFEQSWSNIKAALQKPPKFITNDDVVILRELWLGHTGTSEAYHTFKMQGPGGSQALQKIAATGRFFAVPLMRAGAVEQPVTLIQGSTRPGHFSWQPQPDDRLRPVLRTEPQATTIVMTDPPWYIDMSTGKAGHVALLQPFQKLAEFLSMPPVSPEEAALVATVMHELTPTLPPPPVDDATLRVIEADPVPCLILDSRALIMAGAGHHRHREPDLDFATISFDYAEFTVDALSDTTLFSAANGEIVKIRRHPDIEKTRLIELRDAGLQALPKECIHLVDPQPSASALLVLQDPDGWPTFVTEKLPTLRNKGWRVTMTPTFRFNIIMVDAIDGTARRAEDGWFDVEMGVTVGERTVRMEPLLADLFRRDRRWLNGNLETIVNDEIIELDTDQGERLHLRAERLKPIVRILVDLFDTDKTGPLRISEMDMGRLEALENSDRWQFHGDTTIRQLVQRLQAGTGSQEVAVPVGLRAELRAYQHQGLNWMQFLREHQLSGILADDMGLGKTVQTLAHVLAEKEAGRLDRPALIVVPTTLIHNWCEEAHRFAPDLKVLALNGPQRKEQFDKLAQYHLILTTYALLWRDQQVLAAHHYHLLILDEAQYVKNATTRAAVTIRNLQARHRLCLTGTPLENHLGELWSQFDFLLPGFLGSRKAFTQQWRTPIEKGGDAVRRDLLVRRIRPFMLRRSKDEVAKELPPKTIIVHTVELEGAQRDLYETVRTAMQEKVHAAIAAQGLARSHIIVLKALLKLRQVCCDPRLVKLDKAASVKGSAKLELLGNMLPELIAEGRRILLFSQFTSMLSLIATALDKASIPYVLLTGETTDRRTPLQRFQSGEVPLFLISLKAGGVGLNLTAADTVIHYDPWWNPAVENQATDRAHRIGQEKRLFVYKLIVSGSIEEKIIVLQEKKALLAGAILSEDAVGSVKFSDADLEALLAPIS